MTSTAQAHLDAAKQAFIADLATLVREDFPTAAKAVAFDDTHAGDDAPVIELGAVILADGTEVDIDRFDDEHENLVAQARGILTNLADHFGTDFTHEAIDLPTSSEATSENLAPLAALINTPVERINSVTWLTIGWGGDPVHIEATVTLDDGSLDAKYLYPEDFTADVWALIETLFYNREPDDYLEEGRVEWTHVIAHAAPPANPSDPDESVYVEPVGTAGTTYGPYADEVEASEAMDALGLSDADYKLVWRSTQRIYNCDHCGVQMTVGADDIAHHVHPDDDAVAELDAHHVPERVATHEINSDRTRHAFLADPDDDEGRCIFDGTEQARHPEFVQPDIDNQALPTLTSGARQEAARFLTRLDPSLTRRKALTVIDGLRFDLVSEGLRDDARTVVKTLGTPPLRVAKAVVETFITSLADGADADPVGEAVEALNAQGIKAYVNHDLGPTDIDVAAEDGVSLVFMLVDDGAIVPSAAYDENGNPIEDGPIFDIIDGYQADGTAGPIAEIARKVNEHIVAARG